MAKGRREAAFRLSALAESPITPPNPGGISLPIGRPDSDAAGFIEAAQADSRLAAPASLFVAQTTVKTQVARIRAKLGLRDRAHGVVVAYETGLVRPGADA